jgi:hypothetical protein
VSYTSPTITASSGTLAQLLAEGLQGHLDRLVAANSFSAYQVSLLNYPRNKQADRFWDRVSAEINNYLSGANNPASLANAELLDYATVLKAQLAVIEEIAVLAAAATRTVTTTIDPAGIQAITKVTLS